MSPLCDCGICVCCPVYTWPGPKGTVGPCVSGGPCASGYSCCVPAARFDFARRIHRTVPKTARAMAARTPITIPAIDPPPIPLDDEELSVLIIEEALVEVRGTLVAEEDIDGDVELEVDVLGTAFRTCKLPPGVINQPALGKKTCRYLPIGIYIVISVYERTPGCARGANCRY